MRMILGSALVVLILVVSGCIDVFVETSPVSPSTATQIRIVNTMGGSSDHFWPAANRAVRITGIAVVGVEVLDATFDSVAAGTTSAYENVSYYGATPVVAAKVYFFATDTMFVARDIVLLGEYSVVNGKQGSVTLGSAHRAALLKAVGLVDPVAATTVAIVNQLQPARDYFLSGAERNVKLLDVTLKGLELFGVRFAQSLPGTATPRQTVPSSGVTTLSIDTAEFRCEDTSFTVYGLVLQSAPITPSQDNSLVLGSAALPPLVAAAGLQAPRTVVRLHNPLLLNKAYYWSALDKNIAITTVDLADIELCDIAFGSLLAGDTSGYRQLEEYAGRSLVVNTFICHTADTVYRVTLERSGGLVTLVDSANNTVVFPVDSFEAALGLTEPRTFVRVSNQLDSLNRILQYTTGGVTLDMNVDEADLINVKVGYALFDTVKAGTQSIYKNAGLSGSNVAVTIGKIDVSDSEFTATFDDIDEMSTQLTAGENNTVEFTKDNMTFWNSLGKKRIPLKKVRR